MMSIEEAASHLGVSHRTVRSYLTQGLLRATRVRGSRKKWLLPEEVEELRKDRSEARVSSRTELRRELLEMRASVRRIRSELDVVMQILDLSELPMGLDPVSGKTLFEAATHELGSSRWTLEELGQWAEIFLRLQEEDFLVISTTVEGTPWTPFLRLCVAMIVYVSGHTAYKTTLDLQLAHRRLTEARRRLRISAMCFADMYGARQDETQRELRRAALLDSPESVRESLLRRVRVKNQ